MSRRAWLASLSFVVLGVVGNTGNARTTPAHLHFGVYRVGWWRSRAIDPAPLLGVR